MTISTNIDGGSAFMRIDTEGGRRSLFDIVDLTINAVETASAYSPKANANYKAEVLLNCQPNGRVFFGIDWEFGTKTITALVNEGGLQNMVDAINSASSETGTTASLNADGKQSLC